jgi:predicted nucleic acid-binding protein
MGAGGGKGKKVATTSRHRMLLDASALMALFDPKDSFHEEAVRFRDSFILNYETHLFTTNYILSEALSHLTFLGEGRIRSLINEIRNPASPLRITELWVNQNTVDRALPIFIQYLKHDFSIANCTSFVVMQEHRIDCAFGMCQ